jgi:hypothetical protein
MKDYSDVPVSLGEYNVIGGFDAGAAYKYEYSNVAVPITVVPEPSTLAILLTGLSILVMKKKTKHT